MECNCRPCLVRMIRRQTFIIIFSSTILFLKHRIVRRRHGPTVQTGLSRSNGPAQILYRQRRGRMVSVRHRLCPRRSGQTRVLFERKMYSECFIWSMLREHFFFFFFYAFLPVVYSGFCCSEYTFFFFNATSPHRFFVVDNFSIKNTRKTCNTSLQSAA